MSDEAKAIEEAAKAVQEVAKAGGKAIVAGQKAGGWLDRIFGGAVEDSVALVWSDRVKARRIAAAIYDWERLLLLLEKTRARLRKKRIVTTRIPPPKIMLPLLENATMETEDDLHTLWATLLATALDAKGAEVHRKFVSILSDLTSADAAVLELLWKDWLVVDMEPFKSSATVTYGPGVSGSDKHDEASMVTINRLGLVSPNYVEITTYQPPGHDGDYKEPRTHEDNARAYGDLMTVAFTPLGIAFCEAIFDKPRKSRARIDPKKS